ncbi:hypothetical protein BDR06DRAFT_977984, partial [Suillus hirtellus]
MSGKQAKRNKYDSERRLVACTCGECVSKCGTNGKKTPNYDKCNHSQKEEKAKKSNPVPRAHEKVTKIVAVSTQSQKNRELLIWTPEVPPSLPLSSPTGMFQPHNNPTAVATCEPPTGLADTNSDVFDMLASRMPSPEDELRETEDILLDDFPDAEDEESGPQRTSQPLVGPTSLLGLLDRALRLSNTGEDMLAPAAEFPGSDEMRDEDNTAITNDTPVDCPSLHACE